MRKKRESQSEGGGDEWLNTYADMVTLLLCFFVLLYSMSSLDSQKWEILVRNLNPTADQTSQIVDGKTTTEGTYDFEAKPNSEKTEQVEFENLYYQLTEYVEQNNLQSSMQVSQGEDFTFIMFTNQVFFDGDSYLLKSDGKKVLDEVAGALAKVSDEVGEVTILGHTSQARPDAVNELVSDRFLSSNRATEVLVYLQRKNIIAPEKLVSSGYGQFRPISSFDTADDRSKNRRVEILITKENSTNLKLDDYYKAVYK